MSHDKPLSGPSNLDRSFHLTSSPQQQHPKVKQTQAESEHEAHHQRMVGMLKDQQDQLMRLMQQQQQQSQRGPHLGAQQGSPPPLISSRGLPSPALSVNQYHHHSLPATYPRLAPPFGHPAAPVGPFAYNASPSGSLASIQGPPAFDATSSPPFGQPGINIPLQGHHSRPSPLGTHVTLPSPGYTGIQQLTSGAHVGASLALATNEGFLPPVPSQQYSSDQAVQQHLNRLAPLRTSPARHASYTYSQAQQNIGAVSSSVGSQDLQPAHTAHNPRILTGANAAQQDPDTLRHRSLEALHGESEQVQQERRNREEAFRILSPQAQAYCRTLSREQGIQYLDQQFIALRQARAAAQRQRLDQQNQAAYKQRCQDRVLLSSTVEQLNANPAFVRLPSEQRQFLLQRRTSLLNQHKVVTASPASHSQQIPIQRSPGVSVPSQAPQSFESDTVTASFNPQTRLQQQSPSRQRGSSPLSIPPNPYQHEAVSYISSDNASKPLRSFSKPAQQSSSVDQPASRGESQQQSLADDASFRSSDVDEFEEGQRKRRPGRPKAKAKAQIGRRRTNQVKQAKPRTKQIQKLKQESGNGRINKRGRGASRSGTPKARSNTPPVPPSRQSRASRLRTESQERQLDSGEESASVFERGSTAGASWLKDGKDQVPVPARRVDLNDASFNQLANIVFLKPEECDVSISLTPCLDVANTCELLGDWALPDLGQGGHDSRLAVRTLHFADVPLSDSTLVLLDAAAFQDGNPTMPVTIFALLVKDDSKIRWFYQFAPEAMLHDRLQALEQARCIGKNWSALEPKTVVHKRIFVLLSTAFGTASQIPDHPDWAAAQLLTDYCMDILDEADAEGRLDREPDLHEQKWLDLSSDRYIERLPIAERSLCSTIGIRPSAYLLLKRRFFKDFYKDLMQHKERIPMPAASKTTGEATRRGIARGGGGGRHGRRQKDENVKVRTAAAHQDWLLHATNWKTTKVKRLVASWRTLGFLDEPSYLPWLEAGGMLEEVGQQEQ